MKLLVLCLTANLLLRGTLIPFLLQSLKSLVYSENLLGIFGDQDILTGCFNFVLCLEYCTPVWSFAVDSHLKLLDKDLRACKALIPNLTINLQHCYSMSSLFMPYKIFHNPLLLHSELPNFFHPRRVTRVP